MHDVVAPEHWNEPGDDVTVYPVIDAPPVTGADHETTTCPLPAEADTPVGAPGTVDGVALEEAVDAAPVPDAFVAVTVNVYAVPFVNPVTVQLTDEVVHWNEPGDDVTVYPVIDAPPVLDGAVHDTTD